MMFTFNDNLDVLDDKPIKVLAKVSLIPESEGGRHTPIMGGTAFRPNHNIGEAENTNFYIGQIDFDDGDTVFPGDERTVHIKFLNVRGLREKLYTGLNWRIQEGPKLIAYGEVLEI
jgi:translation elongation factor EF-Tu-like GTPase